MRDYGKSKVKGQHFNPDGTIKKNINKDGSIDYGLFMINDTRHESKGAKLGMNIYTLEGNTAYAYHLYATEGTEPWIWSKPCWVKKANRSNDLREFIPLASLDPVYFENTHYLGADKGGEKPYRPLADAMVKIGRVAIAELVSRGKEKPVLIRPCRKGLVLHTMYHADEVRDFKQVPNDRKVYDRRISGPPLHPRH